jgi:SAM-dependent methyltransferase
MTTNLFQCSCGIICRNLPEERVLAHYDAASYTDPHKEERFYRERIEFFRFLISLAKRHIGQRPERCLDFGCSYGHMLLLLREEGCDTYGVDVCEKPRQMSEQRGLKTYRFIDEIDDGVRFDLITIIDSLYYVISPLRLLTSLRPRLTSDGVLMIRIANRNWLLRLLKMVLRKKHFSRLLGDAIVGYDKKSVVRLLDNCGYKVVQMQYRERGKQIVGFTMGVFYRLTTAITWLSLGSIPISPGIIIVAKASV